MKKPSIVILGAGFGGLATAKALCGCVAKITVIDRSRLHTYTPLLYEVATGFIEHENVGSAKLLQSGAAIANETILSRWGADFIEGEITGVDWAAKRVLLRGGEPVFFDYLVVALGAETNFYGIEGMAENALTLKSVRDADRLRQRIHDFLHKREKDPSRKFTVFIGGAGATGVELAAELTMFLRRHMMRKHLRPEDFEICLVEVQSRVLGMMDPAISKMAAERLQALGVKLMLDTCVKSVAAGRVVLAPRPLKQGESRDSLLCEFKSEEEKVFNADILVWSGGIRGAAALERFGLPLDARGKRLAVNAAFEVAGQPNVFAVGDSALLMDPRTKMPVPWLAQAAMVHGSAVAATIMRRVAGGFSAAAYDFREYPVIFPLGGKCAIFHFKSRTFNGWLGWGIKELANLRYFLHILPFFSALTLWWRGARMYSQND